MDADSHVSARLRTTTQQPSIELTEELVDSDRSLRRLCGRPVVLDLEGCQNPGL